MIHGWLNPVADRGDRGVPMLPAPYPPELPYATTHDTGKPPRAKSGSEGNLIPSSVTHGRQVWFRQSGNAQDGRSRRTKTTAPSAIPTSPTTPRVTRLATVYDSWISVLVGAK